MVQSSLGLDVNPLPVGVDVRLTDAFFATLFILWADCSLLDSWLEGELCNCDTRDGTFRAKWAAMALAPKPKLGLVCPALVRLSRLLL